MGFLSFLVSPRSLFLACFIIFQSIAAAAIPLGSILTPLNSTSWTSPNNTFSLGFISDSNNPSLYLAAIIYTGNIPIWTAGGGSAIVDSADSLQLRYDGNLRLVNGSGTVVWESATANKGVAVATLQESGNLQLTNSSSAVIWQSFDHPTDTIVETQNFTYGQILQSAAYSFALTNTGNLTLKWNNSVLYYNKGLSSFSANATLSSPTLTLQTNGILSLSDSLLPSSAVIAYSSDYAESGHMLRFVRLDSDGNLRTYSSTKGSGTSGKRWSAVEEQCQVFGYCGNMGVCSYNDTSPICGYPSGNFQPVDPRNRRMGCKRKIEIQDCRGNMTMLQLDNTQFLTYPPQSSTEQFFVGMTGCRLDCLSDSSCVASTSLADGSGMCNLKVSNFLSGYQSAALPSTSFLKVCVGRN